VVELALQDAQTAVGQAAGVPPPQQLVALGVQDVAPRLGGRAVTGGANRLGSLGEEGEADPVALQPGVQALLDALGDA
jgi:hypothetical protein